MNENIWWSFLRFLNLLDDLTIYFSIQLGRCAVLSFPALVLVLILRRSVLEKGFFKGDGVGDFSCSSFFGEAEPVL